ncbi:MAG: pilus assembly protein PilM [Chloroflexi bacterium]|nr:pilus assembly protein PilM [Chloroflexota bacterium]
MPVILNRNMLVTLNIETDSVRVVVCQGRRVRRWGTVPLESGLVREGLLTQPEAVGQAVKHLLSSLRVNGDRVVAGLSGFHAVSRVFTLPQIPRKLLEKAVIQEAQVAMPFSLEEAYLSWQTFAPSNGHQQVFALGIPRELLDAEVKALSQAGVSLRSMGLKPMALARAVNKKDAIIVNIEPDSLEITLVLETAPQVIRSLPLRADGQGQKVDTEQVAEEVERTLKFYESGHQDTPLQAALPLVLTGQLSQDEALARDLAERLDRPVEPFAPPIRYPSHFPLAYYAVNIGLALTPSLLARDKVLNLNILPAAYRPKGPPLKQMAFVGGLAVAFGLLYPLYQVTTAALAETRRLESQAAQAGSQIDLRRLEQKGSAALMASLKAKQAKQVNMEEQLASLVQGKRQFPAILDTAVHRTLPAGATITQLTQKQADLVKKEVITPPPAPKGAPAAAKTTITRTTRQLDLSLKGKADSYDTALLYVENLKASGAFSRVWMESATLDDNGVQFSIKAQKEELLSETRVQEATASTKK